MKTFHQFLIDAPDVVSTLKSHASYWAHIHSEKGAELLSEHIKLVNDYADKLVSVHRLDAIIDGLINSYVEKWGNDGISTFLKMLFAHTVVFHDFGKVNENFQAMRMQNTTFKRSTYNAFQPSHGHSYLSAFIYLSYHISLILKSDHSQEDKAKLMGQCFLFAYPILQHHSPALFNAVERDGLFTRFKEVLTELKPFLEKYTIEFDEAMLGQVFANIEQLWFNLISDKIDTEAFPLFALIKLNFSLLTAADYLATHEYMNSSEAVSAATTDFGVLESEDRIRQIYEHLTAYKHNAEVYKELENQQTNFPQKRSRENLNFLRKQMAIEVVKQIKANADKNLFYLEAPTGGGKTNLSSLAVGELLMKNPDLNKVFYVFPFTTLITQTFQVLREAMGLKNQEIVELHSKADFVSRAADNNCDGKYGADKKDFIDRMFALHPFTLLSHVKFFDILKTNNKEQNYLLHRLANSVVVIDEIQSYNPRIWDKMLFFIESYARFFNIKFILMSATLPKIGDLNIGLSRKTDFVDLLPNARQYLTNINFSGRVQFNLELLEEQDFSLDQLADTVMEKSEEYANRQGSVKTIVEFIYKKSATAFQRLFDENDFFDEIFVLSGTILESRRKEVINFVKRNKDGKINILLITTQVVEAGVDIDMDLGFKNVSLLDSDEQLAGRVNRNASKEISDVFLFNIDDAKVLYGNDHRYKRTAEMQVEERQAILKDKDFRKLYEKVLLSIDDSNNPFYADAISSYQNEMKKLSFVQVDKEFRIIDQANNSVFVPISIPVEIEGSENGRTEHIFTTEDLSFLADLGTQPKYDEASEGEVVRGDEIWLLYESFIENNSRAKSFDLQQKINFKKLQTIMSKYTFSLISHSKDYREMQNGFGYEKYGFFLFDHHADFRENGQVYDYKSGLNSDAFSDSNFI